jgi:hypothetical protein
MGVSIPSGNISRIQRSKCSAGHETASILVVVKFGAKLELALDPYFRDVKSFLDTISPLSRREFFKRVQIVVFWALCRQKGHATAQTFCQNSRHEEELAPAPLDPMVTLPGKAVENVLGSIFADTRLISNPHESKAPPPFATPFGASVLTCDKRGCGVMFYDPEDPKSFEPDAVHKRRTEHLKETYGLGFLFVHSPHGMPENTLAPKPLTSTHCNLHSSIARVWSALPPTTEWNQTPSTQKP